jgi:hypothetical protein
MASKKKVKRPKRRPTPKKPPKPSPYPGKAPPKWDGDLKCNMPHVCEFLQQLSDWLNNQFIPDYTALRVAVCNVEKQAFSGTGNPNKPPRFCTGGGGAEPAPPPPPPVW